MEISTFLDHQEQDTLNVKQLKAFYQAAREGDRETLIKLLVDVPIWNVCPGFPEGGIYSGIDEVYGSFYPKLRSRFHFFGAIPDVFVDGGDVITVLGFYKFIKREGEPFKLVRFAHTWRIDPDGRIGGVWQVADSAQFIKSDEADATGA